MITERRTALRMLLSMAAFSTAALSSGASSASPTQAQSSVDSDVDLLRKDIRSDKKQLVAANMKLTDSEAEKFWPVYDQYTAELVKINDKKYAAIKQFAENYETLTDAMSDDLTKQVLGIDESVAELRLKYVSNFRKVISGKKTALFFQIDRRLVMLIDLRLASIIPLVEQ